MAEKKPKPGAKPKSAPAGANPSKAGLGSKLGGLFSRKPKGKKPKPLPQKGQSSFLKNFNVKDVGEEPKSDKKEKQHNFQPAKKEAENWTSMVGPREGKSDVTSSGRVKLPAFKPSSSQLKEEEKKRIEVSMPKLEPKSKVTPKLAPLPAERKGKPAVKSIQLPPMKGVKLPPVKSAAKVVELPPLKPAAKGGELPPLKPAEADISPTPKLASNTEGARLLPGQKKGEIVGAASATSGVAIRDKSSKERPASKGLPSLSAKALTGFTGKIPPAKPPVPLKPKAVEKPAPKPVKIEDLPAPSRKATAAGTLKKESVRLDKLQKSEPKVAPAPKPVLLPKPAEPKKTLRPPKPVEPARSAQPTKPAEPEFSKPPIPLDPSKLKTAPLKSKAKSKPKPEGKEVSKEIAKPVAVPKLDKPTEEKKPKPAASAKVAKTVTKKETDRRTAKTSTKARHKKSPKVVLPPVREESSGNSKMVILIPLIVLLIAGIAFFVYWTQRETSVEVSVNSGELTTRGEAMVVLNFAGKLEMLRNDYFRRRTPVEEEIGHIKANLSAAQGDLAGRNQRKKLLEDALEGYQAEIPQYLHESQQALDRLWNEESAALSKEYDDFKESLHQQIETRSQELGVDYTRNAEIDAIAVAVNAYRLALYGVAQQVDVGEQRSWAEDLLQQWDAFEKTWREEQADIKKKALEIKKDPVPKISETRKRIDNLEREIDALDTDLNSLQSEVARYQSNLTEANARLQAIDGPFYSELRAIPEEFKVASFPIDELGKIILPDLQDSIDLSEGTHFLLVAAVKADQEYWAIQEFEVLPYQAVNVVVDPSRFTDLKTVLEKGTFMKP